MDRAARFGEGDSSKWLETVSSAMRVPIAIAVLLIAAPMAGCIETGPVPSGGGDEAETDPQDGAPSEDVEPGGTYELIWVRGLEDHPDGGTCDEESTHAVDRGNRTLYHRANESFRPSNVSTIVAVTIWTTSGCRVHDAVHVNEDPVEARTLSLGFGEHRWISVSHGDVRRDVAFQGTRVFTYGQLDDPPTTSAGPIDGTLQVHHLTSWPRSNLTEVDAVPEEALDWPVRGDPPLRLTPWRMDEVSGSYHLAFLGGHETEEPSPNVACEIRFSHGVDAAHQRLAYDANRYRFDPANLERVITLSHSKQNGCGGAYGFHPNAEAIENRSVGHYGEVSLAFEANGTLNVSEGPHLQAGENVTFPYSRQIEEDGQTTWINGSVEISHLLWPRSSLEPQPWRPPRG